MDRTQRRRAVRRRDHPADAPPGRPVFEEFTTRTLRHPFAARTPVAMAVERDVRVLVLIANRSAEFRESQFLLVQHLPAFWGVFTTTA